MARRMLLTHISQMEVEVTAPIDYTKEQEQNCPGPKWALVTMPNDDKVWHPIHDYTFSTPDIRNDFTKARIVING